jgi:hypothetical protein
MTAHALRQAAKLDDLHLIELIARRLVAPDGDDAAAVLGAAQRAAGRRHVRNRLRVPRLSAQAEVNRARRDEVAVDGYGVEIVDQRVREYAVLKVANGGEEALILAPIGVRRQLRP